MLRELTARDNTTMKEDTTKGKGKNEIICTQRVTREQVTSGRTAETTQITRQGK